MNKLRLRSEALSQESINAFTRDLEQAINTQTDIHADFPESEAATGDKGSEIELGTLLITMLSSGTCVALLELIRAFFDRDKSIEIEIEHSDRKFALRAENVSQDRIDDTINAFKSFLSEDET